MSLKLIVCMYVNVSNQPNTIYINIIYIYIYILIHLSTIQDMNSNEHQKKSFFVCLSSFKTVLLLVLFLIIRSDSIFYSHPNI